jgi:hypothetical protein
MRVYVPVAHATTTLPTKSAQLAMERRQITPVHGRLLYLADWRDTFLPLPTRPPRVRTQSQERQLGAYTSLRAPRHADRHYNLYLPSPSFETTRHCYPLPGPIATLCTRRPLATCPTTRRTRRKSVVPLPPRTHPGGSLLPPRTTRLPRNSDMMGKTGKTHLSVEAGPPVLDKSPLRQQRSLHLLPNRDRLLLALRQLRLRLGGSVERAIGSMCFLSAKINGNTSPRKN